MVVYKEGDAQQENPVSALSFGYLRINVAAAQRALPVQNAQIMVYSSAAETQQELLAVLRTDSSGETEMISLPSPELAESQQPQPPDGERPYNLYFVRIVAENYVTRDKVPVQIFPGVLSNLVINMQAPVYIG